MNDKLTAIKVDNLHVTFKNKNNFEALKGLSFQIKTGQTLALIGQSGSGKSVTALALMGLLPPNATIQGDILLHSYSDKQSFLLTESTNKQWQNVRGKHIGMIFQEPMSALNPIMTCGRQLTESILVHQKISFKQAKRIAIDWMEKVQLPTPDRLFKRYPHQLSGGQKQRLMIAMALCNYPALLIADEPTTALDVTVQKGIMLLLKKLQKELNIAILLITHDLALANIMTEQYLVLKNGNMMPDASSLNLVNKHSNLLRLQSDRKQVILDLNKVAVHFKEKDGLFSRKSVITKAVDSVSFSIFHGETVGLVGESGCGKSTLSKTILGLQALTAGDIFFKGKSLMRLTKNGWRTMRRKIQIIFQDPYSSLNPRMNIADILSEPMLVHGLCKNRSEAMQKVKGLLESVALPLSVICKYPHEFSGGQRQRICIARALALSPELIICDESVAALDVKNQSQILDLLVLLQQEKGLTYLFITHDLQVVRNISNRLLIMKDGKIVEQGMTEDVMTQPKHPYTRQLLQSALTMK